MSFFLSENVEKRHLFAFWYKFPTSDVHSKKRKSNPKSNPKLHKGVTLNSNPKSNPKSKRTQKRGHRAPSSAFKEITSESLSNDVIFFVLITSLSTARNKRRLLYNSLFRAYCAIPGQSGMKQVILCRSHLFGRQNRINGRNGTEIPVLSPRSVYVMQ